MTAIVYQHTEAPLVVDNLEQLIVHPDGDDLTIVNPEEKWTFSMQDVIRVELVKDDQ